MSDTVFTVWCNIFMLLLLCAAVSCCIHVVVYTEMVAAILNTHTAVVRAYSRLEFCQIKKIYNRFNSFLKSLPNYLF